MTYAQAELMRTFRDRMTFLFTFGFPLILFWIIAGPNQDAGDWDANGVDLTVYYMTSMAAYGAMVAVVAGGARIAHERELGWTRQLRITPLTAVQYFRAKIGVSYVAAGSLMLLIYVSGFALGVRLPADEWLQMTGLILIGLIPFAALGVIIGHVVRPDGLGPVMGGGVGLLALLSGFWFPINSGIVHDIAEFLPSWWLVQASHASLGGDAWGLQGWLTVAAWSVGLTLVAVRVYQRDAGLR